MPSKPIIVKILLGLLLISVGLIIVVSILSRPSGSGKDIPQKNEMVVARDREPEKTSGLSSQSSLANMKNKTGENKTSVLEKSDTSIKIDDYIDELSSRDTLQFFQKVHHLFNKSKDLKSHIEEVRAYLFEMLPEEEAKVMLAVYEKYLNCEIVLASEYDSWPKPFDLQSKMANIERLYEFRVDYLGEELAKVLFEPGMKDQAYRLKQSEIVYNKDLYGEEKENMIEKLKNDTWGEDAEFLEDDTLPYNKYQKQLQIYAKDLSEIKSDIEKQEQIQEFRAKYFEPEAIKRLEAVDRQLLEEKSIEDAYRGAEKEILANSDLSEEEMQYQIEEAQNEFFKDQADAFRRSETMKKALE